jgi:hypothetical protein
MCIAGRCLAKPAPANITVGNRASSASQCSSGKISGKFCQGVPTGGECSATDQTKICDVGLYCNAGVCASQLADGANCTAGQCQSNSLCYPDGLCHKWYFLDTKSKATDPKMCKSGWIRNDFLQCWDRPKVNVEWFSNTTDPAYICKYDDNLSQHGTCITYSGDPSKAGYCINYQTVSYESMFDYVNKYTANSCAANDPFCDKAAEAYGCDKFKDVMKANFHAILKAEKLYPDCEEKLYTKMIDSYVCSFAKELMCGLLTFLAIILLI